MQFDKPKPDMVHGKIKELEEIYGQRFEVDKSKAFTKIDKILKFSPLLVFIKGSQDEPKDDDSKEIISYLNELNLKFVTYDVLRDRKIRQWLKFYTDFQSYPQVFVENKFIGGLDYVK